MVNSVCVWGEKCDLTTGECILGSGECSIVEVFGVLSYTDREVFDQEATTVSPEPCECDSAFCNANTEFCFVEGAEQAICKPLCT